MLKSLTILAIVSSLSGILRVDGVSSVEATARGPAGISIVARSSKVESEDTGENLTVKIPVTSFSTGIELRDSHMRKLLEAERFPDVKLVVEDKALKRPAVDDTISAKIPAKLTLHGVTKDITVDYDASADCEGAIGAHVTFKINLRDFNIEPPSYLGISVKPDVAVSAKIRFLQNS